VNVIPKILSISHGSGAFIKCHFDYNEHHKDVTVRWTFKSYYSTKQPLTLPPDVSVDDRNSILIKSVEYYHSGEYTCTLNTRTGKGHSTATLDVTCKLALNYSNRNS